MNKNFETILRWGRSSYMDHEMDLYTKPQDDNIVIPTWPWDPILCRLRVGSTLWLSSTPGAKHSLLRHLCHRPFAKTPLSGGFVRVVTYHDDKKSTSISTGFAV